MMNKNNRKNTNRPAGGQGGNNNITRSSPRAKGGPMADGVYNNSHFLHAAASQMGNTVQVKTKGGIVVEGIFRAFSEDFSIALEVPHRYQMGADNKKINVDTVQDNLIIKMCDIVSMQAKDVDLDFATRDTFQTDTAISARVNGSLKFGAEKKLEPWEEDSGNGNFAVSLELDTQANGWDANEMFSLNEKEHGIKTTFKDNLESYTVQIEKNNTDDFKEKEKEAARIAAEIENNPITRDRLDLENGDEEAAFASVVRPEDSASNNNEKMTPPPNNNSQKYTPGQQKQSNRQQQERKIVPNSGKTNMYSKSTAPMQPQQGAVQQTVNAGGFKTMTINPMPQYPQPPPTHYQTSQNQQQNQNENKNVNNNNNNNESNSNANNKPVQQRQVRMMNTQMPMTFSEPPPNLNPVTNQHMGKPPVMSVHMPPPTHDGQQAIHVVQPPPVMIPPPGTIVVAQQPVHAIHAAPQAQRPQIRSRNEDFRNLRQFGNDFNLQSAPPAGPPQQQQNQSNQQHHQQPPPQVPTSQQDMNSMVEIKSGNVQHHPTPSSTPHSVIAEKAQTPPTVATPSLQNSNSNSSVANSSSNSTETTPPSSNDKPSLGAKKFTLNPQAKPFTPRSPSTPTQSRPHTPQTPGPMPAQQPTQTQQIPQPPPQQIYFYLHQRPTPPPMAVRSKHIHQYQVNQATGQPIFNPPVPPPAVMQAYHPHPQQIPTVPQQTYPQAQLRMIDVQQQPHVTQYIVQQPPTSTTPSPGQPHQSVFHPGPQPSPAAGPPQAFPHQQYVMVMPGYAAPHYINQNQHNQQQLQVVMQQQQPAQHPSQ